MVDTAQARLDYLESEKGNVLTRDANGTTWTVTRVTDGAVILGPGATLANVESHCAGVDPSIIGIADTSGF